MKTWKKTNKKGVFQMVQLLKSGLWLGQLTGNEIVETSKGPHLTRTDFVLDHFKTAEEALDAVGYPVDVVGIPKELI